MRKKSKQRLLGGCLTVAFVMSTTLSTSVVAFAETQTNATTNAPIQRIGGIDRYETAAKVAQEGWSKSEYAVLSAGMNDNLVDALTAAPLARLKNAPILLTQGNELNVFAEAELLRLGVKKVYVTSGLGVISEKVLDRLSKIGIEVIRLGGVDRFETSVNIAKQVGTTKNVVLTTGWTNADALSVASIAAAKGMPILLTEKDAVPGTVSTYLNSVKDKVSKTYILGKEGAVSQGVASSVPNPVRIGGEDRYGTNLEILKAFSKEIKYAAGFVANGNDAHLVDALAASPLAAQLGAAITLTDSSMPEATKAYAKNNLSPNPIALGGETVVSSEIIRDLTNATLYSEENGSLGSSDQNSPMAISDVIKVTGDNFALKNANLEKSVIIQGDQASLSNLNVNGTIFIQAPDGGSISLDNVKAKNIVVIPRSNSLRIMAETKIKVTFKGVTADVVLVQNGANVESTNSNVTSTVVDSAAILNAISGSLGNVIVGGTTNAPAEVEFIGTFGSVVVTGKATINATSARVTQLEVSTDKAGSEVTLKGNFTNVVLNSEATLNLAAGTTVGTIVANSNASLNVDSSARVDNMQNNGNNVQVGGSGASNVGTGSGAPGGSGSTVIYPKFTAFSTGVDNSRLNNNVIAFMPTNNSYANLSNASITVNEAPVTMKLYQGTSQLGQWTLSETVNNDLFTLNNISSLNVLNTFTALEAAHVTSSELFAAVNFTDILTTLQGASQADRNKFFDTILPAFTGYGDAAMQQAIIGALDLPTIYAAASNKSLIEAAFEPAANYSYESSTSTFTTGGHFVGKTNDSVAAWYWVNNMLSEADRQKFYTEIDFGILVEALKTDANKAQIYSAINFQQIFDAIKNQNDPTGMYQVLVSSFNALKELDCKTELKGAVSIVDMLKAISRGGDLKVTLTYGSLTPTEYSIVFPNP